MNLLLAAAVVPGLFLIYYVYQQDKIEKEPIGLLVRLGLWGAVGVFVAMAVENLLIGGLEFFFDKKSTVFLLLENFLGVALVEEYVKYRALKKAWNHPAFDYRFDAIVYSVAVGMGFAILENIFYVFENGFEVAIMRACTSLPGHCIFAIYMGYYFGEAKMCEVTGNSKGMSSNLTQALWMPTMLHGFFDYCLSADSDTMILTFLVFIVAMDIKTYKKLKAASANDTRLF